MINDIYVYKIGISNYEGAEDKNSGSYEYEMIIKELEEVVVSGISRLIRLDGGLKGAVRKFNSALVVVGGRPNNEMDDMIEFMVKEKMFDLTVFIATDVDCLKMNRRLIDSCDYLLHQSPIYLGYKDKKHETYSWVPEIFYNPDNELFVPKKYKNNSFLFAGSLDGREEKVKNFCMNCKNLFKRDIIVIPKIKGEEWVTDCRLEYKEYKKLLSLFGYTYICVCKEAEYIGWVTSRLVEAVSCDVFPYVDSDYDKYGHFEGILNNCVNGIRDVRVGDLRRFLYHSRVNFQKLLTDILFFDNIYDRSINKEKQEVVG